MTEDTDPNVIYGGDPGETTKVDENCPSLGAMTMLDFKLGENKPCLVKSFWVLIQIRCKSVIVLF